MNEKFKEVIQAYLDKRAAEDSLFAITLKKPNKNIDECCQYIIGEVKKQAKEGACFLEDNVVYGMAVHYYDEDDIEIDKTAHASVGAKTELTEDDKAEAKRIAMDRAIAEQQARLRAPKTSKKTDDSHQLSLFDML